MWNSSQGVALNTALSSMGKLQPEKTLQQAVHQKPPLREAFPFTATRSFSVLLVLERPYK